MDFRKTGTFCSSLLILIFQVVSTAEAQTSLEVSASAKINGGGKYSTPADRSQNKIVVVTGVRFTYPLVQKWIDDYAKINPEVQVIIESRGSTDPTKYDILIEAYEPDAETKKRRDYVYMGRYAILSVANSQSAFSKQYTSKGLHRDLIKQLFFHDIFLAKKEQTEVKAPYTVYTRLQKAGSPITFSNYFGYQQKDIKGKSIAGSDEHLLKAVLRDSSGLTYAPLCLLYDLQSGKPIQGLTILPVDLNGNGKISDDEKFYESLSTVVQRLEEKSQKEIYNIPIEYLNLSIDKSGSNPEAVSFLQWVMKNGEGDLHSFGFLKPEPGKRNEQP